DEINIRPILFIGAALVLVCALTYVAVTVVFSYIHVGAEDPVTYPMAAEKAAAPINERFARIDSVGEEAEVRQPRLEALQRRRYAPGEPPYVRSPVPTAEGNPPFYHPEDLRAERVPALNRYEWVNKDKNVAAIPIEQAMEAALEMGLYQTQKAAPKEGGGTEGREEPEGQEAKKPEPGKKEPAPKPE